MCFENRVAISIDLRPFKRLIVCFIKNSCATLLKTKYVKIEFITDFK